MIPYVILFIGIDQDFGPRQELGFRYTIEYTLNPDLPLPLPPYPKSTFIEWGRNSR